MLRAIIISCTVVGIIVFGLTCAIVYLLEKEFRKMSEQKRTKQEYLERFANDYCDGDQEEAAGHAIVKEVCKNLESE